MTTSSASLALLALVLALVLATGCPGRPADSEPAPERAAGAGSQTRDASAVSQGSAVQPDAALDVLLAGAPVRAEPPERDPDAPRVRLKLTVLPVDAEVSWGRKKLGIAGRRSLEIERPRNSGPLDVVIRAPGFLPYHTRLHTDRDDVLTVRLVRPAEARSLLGWKSPGKPGSDRR